MMDDQRRPPWYPRAYQLFAEQHFDSASAALLARSEYEQRRKLDENEPQAPTHRMTGFERGSHG